MKNYYVVSYPKSGATWFRFLIYAIFHQKLEKSGDVGYFYPEYPKDENIWERLEDDKPLFIKSHSSYEKSLDIVDKVDQVIHLVRNPLNIMGSKYDFYKLEGQEYIWFKGGKAKIYTDLAEAKFYETFMREADWPPEKLDDEHAHGGWNYMCKSWEKAPIKNPLIIVKYEDLIDDPVNTLKTLLQKLDMEFSEEEIKNAVELSSFENIQKLEEKELVNETPGLFYTEQRKKNFLEKNERFVKSGASRDTFLRMDTELILQAKLKFFSGMMATGYLE